MSGLPNSGNRDINRRPAKQATRSDHQVLEALSLKDARLGAIGIIQSPHV